MAKYRDRLQIIADILEIVGKGSRKTRIMYRANLSYRLLCRYLDEVLDSGLAKCQEPDSYELTQKGEDFLVRYDEYTKRCEGLAEHQNSVNIQKVALENMCQRPAPTRSSSTRQTKVRAKR